ncbi:MAG TPA: response regulator transcription factor [Polyangiaceae bacterium]|nr:response regulator transcription factor [Polyangiaceae bacterium]
MSKVSPTVMVVDDSELACEGLRHTLGNAGINVVALNSPFGFIKALRENNPQILLVDVGLGTMNGMRLVQLGRQHAPSGCAILLYSGREDSQLAEDVKASAADGYLSKRVTGTDLVNAVRRWLSNGAKPGVR